MTRKIIVEWTQTHCLLNLADYKSHPTKQLERRARKVWLWKPDTGWVQANNNIWKAKTFLMRSFPLQFSKPARPTLALEQPTQGYSTLMGTAHCLVGSRVILRYTATAPTKACSDSDEIIRY